MKIFFPVYKTGGHKNNKSALIEVEKSFRVMTARLRLLGVSHIMWKFFYDKTQIELD